jgi:Family of unknown function (DUF6364)
MTHPSKLTLRLDSGLIEGAKAFAQEHERSVSQLVADYFTRLGVQSLSSPSGNMPVKLSPTTRSLVGALKAKHTTKIKEKPQNKIDSDKEMYRKHLESKYK